VTEFGANLYAFGDTVGRGEWEIGHYRQHLDYQRVLGNRTPPVILPDFPVMRIGETSKEIRFWLDAHESLHNLLRPLANVQGTDLSQLDWQNPGYFYEWMQAHNDEHTLLDQAFGVQ
jgi:hypothetical protein